LSEDGWLIKSSFITKDKMKACQLTRTKFPQKGGERPIILRSLLLRLLETKFVGRKRAGVREWSPDHKSVRFEKVRIGMISKSAKVTGPQKSKYLKINFINQIMC
jgi:hypothetical protein